MKVIKMSEVKPEEAAGNLFEGKVTKQTLIDPELSREFRASLITFSPGARNVFHAHTKEQVLYVTEGRGIVATKEEEHTVTPGTIILIPAGEVHWHGATQDSAFAHITLTAHDQKTTF